MTAGAGPAPVVSVGNLALGGRGKTPVVAALATLLADAGEAPAILSRGYRRRRPEDGVVVVSDGRRLLADLDRSGDEPLMLARAVPRARVLVCEVRALAAAVAEDALGATVQILDDGFQHRALARDVDIVLVAPHDLADRRLPFGRLRSGVRSLARADAVIVDGPLTDEMRAAVLRAAAPRQPMIFSMTRRLGAIEPLEPARGWPGSVSSVLALAGIARPARFADALRAAGYSVAGAVSFGDHHRYGPRDLARIAAALRDARADVVLTTSKDAVRLLPMRPLPVPIAAVPLSVAIAPADEFQDWLLARIREVRG